MLTPKQVKFIQEELATSKNPLFFYDDDPDGLCSFLLFYRIHHEGKGIIVKSSPKLDHKFSKKVEENNPDKIFVLDVPVVEQEFIDQARRPVFWVDHHQPLKLENINYFNPRLKEPNLYCPTSRMAYQINNLPEDLWIAAVGCVGDYHLPDFLVEFQQKYPDFLDKNLTIEQAIYDSKLGTLVRIFSFLLKGKTSEVNKCVRILTRIKSPAEILNQETPAGKYLYRRFQKVDQKYQEILKGAKKVRSEEKVLLFTYTEKEWSFTAELAGELLYLHPNKIVMVTRKKSGEMKGSVRSKTMPIDKVLEKALLGIKGYGGGHEMACGINIKEEDWEKFLENFKRELG